ncbi:MAG: serine/threonine-protein kinase [candidate division KSB1 bacterium]|nr:serine/threonine-protein kinase [candidate division KSB1 bacterium]MDZ7368307.1 serine/threonine-protein kinase [candidate division KSB1 bacterium]MDZ7406113.1 serine/threonine-protein kinase [candidate division KSB1 bacterium]
MPNVDTSTDSSTAKFSAWQQRRARQRRRAKWPLLIGSAVFALAAMLHLRTLPFAGIFERLERANLDLFFRLRGELKPDSRIHLVVIDDASLQQVGGWPWPRLKLAELLTRVLARNPKLVVCDFMLPDKPEEASGTKTLADVVASSQKIIFPYYFSDLGNSAGNPIVPEAIAASAYLLFDFREKLLRHPPVAAGAVNHASQELLAASLPGGHINLFPEEDVGDAKVRWEAQILRYGDSYFPSLPVQAAAQFLQLTRGQVQVKVGSGIQIGDIFVPTDERGWTLINYYGGAGAFPQTSAAVILQKGALSALAGKIVFIGLTAAGTQDFVPTPISSRLPGVEKLATSTSNILQGDALIRNNTVENFEFVALIVLGLAALLAALRLPRLYIGVVLLGLVLLTWVGAFGFFTLSRMWIQCAGIIFAIITTGGVTTFLRQKLGVAPQIEHSFGDSTRIVVTDANGELIRLGRFEIIGEIGAGAMGKIYEGYDPTINRRVAIKTIRADLMLSGSERVRQRFLREAQAAGALNHPNIVTIYQADEAGPFSFIAMEFLEGETFEKIIEKRAPLTLEEICRLVAPVCDALDYAHRNGVVHRDIKPANIMLTHDGIVKVMDFGIAHVDYSTLTQDGAVLGTPSYMSPEQIRGEKVDGQSDMFSLGVIVYEMATGQRPFVGESLATISNRILAQMPILASDLNPKLSPAFDAALVQAMAKDKTQRFAMAKEFAEALQAVCVLAELSSHQ